MILDYGLRILDCITGHSHRERTLLFSIQNPQSSIKNQLPAVFVLFLTLTLTPTTLHALTPATLITPELENREINLTGLNNGELQFFDQDRRLVRAPAADFVRLDFGNEQDPAAWVGSGTEALGMVYLVDGQRIAGRWVGSDGGGTEGGGDVVVWEHDALGRFYLRLDEILRMELSRPDANPAPPPAGADPALSDAVDLVNGDRLTGFVLSVGDDGLALQIDGSDTELVLPRPQIVAITLANTPLQDPAAGNQILVTDASRLRCSTLSIQSDALTMVPVLARQPEPVELPLFEVQHIDFAATGRRLARLTDQPMRTVSGGAAFGLDWPPLIEGGDLRLHAPTIVEFTLPTGARRFAGTAELDLPSDLDEANARWADLLFWVGDQRVHLHAGAPSVTINLPLGTDESRLTIRVDPARYGPILDRLRLRDAVILIDRRVVDGPTR